MKQTAVEWLVEQLKEYDWADIKDSQNWVIKIDALVLTAKVEQAKTMEKEQIKKAVTFGNRQECYDATETLGEQHYNETYNK
jgi:hypothetical protein